MENNNSNELDGALIIDDDVQDGRGDDVGDARDGDAHHGYDGDPSEDGKADLALEMVHEILKRMNLDIDVEVRRDDEEVVLDLTGEDTGRVIGKKGQTLDALQFLVNKIVNRFPEGRRHVVLDSGDYRERRESGLASLARREAKRAVQQSRIVTLKPMSPRDRRVIHLSLAKFPGVSTRSDGQGSDRRVRIIPARQHRGERNERGPRVDRGERGGRSDG